MKKVSRMSKHQHVGIVEQILDDKYVIGIEGYTNKQLKEVGAMMTYLAKNRQEAIKD